MDASGARTYFQRRGPALWNIDRAASWAIVWSGAAVRGLVRRPECIGSYGNRLLPGHTCFLNLESQYDDNPRLSGCFEMPAFARYPWTNGSFGRPGRRRPLVDRSGCGNRIGNFGSERLRCRPGTAGLLHPASRDKGHRRLWSRAAFSAGIIYGLRAGWSLENSARFASAYAALKCEVGGIAALSISEVQKAAANVDSRPQSL